MESPSIISRAIETIGLNGEPMVMESLSASCLHDVRRIKTGNDFSVVCKCSFDPDGATRLLSEKNGLEFLSSLNVPDLLVPEVLGIHVDPRGVVLMTEWIEAGPVMKDGWSNLGRVLASMHSMDVGDRYGFHESNHIGSTLQVNDWSDDWIQFNRSCRFAPQLELATRSGLLRSEEIDLIERVSARLEEWIPENPPAAPLHGDLWAGNVMHSVGGRVAVIDPACSIGDGWADIAMLDLFGSIPMECFEAYSAAVGCRYEDMKQRVGVYQLYHVLNHVNLFGHGYLSQLTGLLNRLLDS